MTYDVRFDEKKKLANILAIETSCDETAASLVELSPSPRPSPVQGGGVFGKIKTLSSVVKSQITIHKKYGGVFPEAAAMAHIKYIRPVVERTINNSQLTINDIDYIAVTVGPGLNPSLLVGVEFAKGLSYATGKPVIPVNHLAGHLYSPIRHGKGALWFCLPKSTFAVFPIISLIVSGGHTILVLMKDLKNYKVLGQTVDDAAGEAFDKIARLLGLPYPGGPELSKLARNGNPRAIDFPRPMLNKKNYNFSFSGLKTSVLYYLKSHKSIVKNHKFKADIAASAQQAIVDVLIGKTLRAAKEYKAKSVAISGGVSANNLLRKTLRNICKKENFKFFMPPVHLSTDNAEMIGIAAGLMLQNGFKPVSYKKVDAQPNLKL